MKFTDNYEGETRASNCGGGAPCIVRPIKSKSKMNDRPEGSVSSSSELKLDEDLINTCAELLGKYC